MVRSVYYTTNTAAAQFVRLGPSGNNKVKNKVKNAKNNV